MPSRSTSASDTLSEAPRRRRPLRRAGCFLVLLVVAGLAALLSLYAVLQAPPARRYIRDKINERLDRGADFGIALGDIRGQFPGIVWIERVQVRDRNGVWLVLEDVRADFEPASLLRKRLVIDDASVARAVVRRKPAGKERDEIPSIPDLLERLHGFPHTTVRKLSLSRLELEAPVLGQAVVLSASGGLWLGTDPVAVRLALETHPEPSLRLALEARARHASDSLAFRLDLHEEPEGPLANRFGLDPLGGLSGAVWGRGPLSDWNGFATLASGNNPILSSRIGLEMGDATAVSVSGTLDVPAALVPEKARSWLAEPGEFAVTARLGPRREIAVDHLTLDAAGLAVDGAGAVDLGAATMSVRADVAAKDLAVFSTVAGAKLGGALTSAVRLEGPVRRPRGQFDLTAEAVRVNQMTVASVNTAVEAVAETVPDGAGERYRIAGEGRAQGFTLPSVEGLTDDEARWSLEATASPDGAFSLDAPIDAPALAAQARIVAQAAAGDSASQWNLSMTLAELERLSDVLGRELTGAAELNAEFRAAPKRPEETLAGTAHVAFRNLGGLPETVAAFLGAEGRVRAEWATDGFDVVKIQSLEAETDALTLAAEGAFDRRSGALSARYSGDLPDVSVLSPVLGEELSGAVAAKGEVEGGRDNLHARIAVTSDQLTRNGVSYGPLEVHVEAQDLPHQPTGAISLRVAKAGQVWTGAGGFARTAEALEIREARLEGPRFNAAAELQIQSDSQGAEGRVDVRARDLGPLGDLLGMDLAGRARLALRLEATSGRQNVRADFTAENLESPYGRVASLESTADLSDVRGTPSGSARWAINDYVRGAVRVTRAQGSVQGNRGNLGFTVEAEGAAPEPFTGRAGGSLALEGDRQTLILTGLEATYAGEPANLTEPAVIVRDSRGFATDGASMAVGGGRVAVSGRYGADAVDLLLSATDLSLERLERFGLPSFGGTAEGEVRFAGTPAAPALDVRLDLRDVRPDPARAEDLAVNVAAHGSLSGGTLAASATVSGLSEAPGEARLTTPMDFSLVPFALAWPEDAPLDGALRLAVDLGDAAPYYLPSDQFVEGRLDADVRVRGTRSRPGLDGTVHLADGRYENLVAGTVLTGMVLDARFAGDRVTVERFEASDGGSGSLSATGGARLNAEPQFEMDATLRQARLVRRPDVTAVLSGPVTVSGTRTGATVRGDLTVDSGEYFVSLRSKPDVASLDVVEVNGPEEEAPAPEPVESAASPEPGFPVHLDVDVALPGQFYVRGQGIVAELEGRLEIGNTLAQPAITGPVTVRRGHFNFLQNRFDLAESRADFDGRTPPDPQLDVRAVARRPALTATLRVVGPLSDPAIELESEPPLPDDQILAQLLFGRDLTEITPLQALRVAAAAETLSGRGGLFEVAQRTRAAVGLDIVDIEMADGVPTLGVGRYLTDDVYLQVRKELEGSGGGGVSVEVQVSPGISIVGGAGTRGQGGVELNWSHDY